MEKTYITANDLLLDAFRLAANIYHSGYRPDLLVGVWRGGTPVAIAVQEYFEYMGAATDHTVIRCSSYTGIASQAEVRIHGMEYIINQSDRDTRLLIVDDVFDSGLSIRAFFDELTRLCGDSLPRDIRTATPWYKPGNNKTDLAPDYYLHTTDQWLVFPHELCGLSEQEIKANKGGIYPILSGGASSKV